MDTTIPDWPEVTVLQFSDAMETFRRTSRSAWANAIVWRDEDTGQIIGCEVGRNCERCLLHPGLVEETTR